MEASLQSSFSSFLNPDQLVSELGLTPGMSVGDFGSGSGHLAILTAQRIGPQGKVYAIDILEDKLDSVRVKAKEAGVQNIETIRANLEVLGSSGLPDASQDIVLLVNILFQSQKKEDILREARRVLKNEGKLALIEWKKGTGGFGPPDELRMEEEQMNSLIVQQGFTYEKPLYVGQFHYGLMFFKQSS